MSIFSLRLASRLLLIWLLGLASSSHASEHVFEATGIQWATLTASQSISDVSMWQKFSLPHHWRADDRAGPQDVAVRITFALDAVPSSTWAVLIAENALGGSLIVNGQFVGGEPVADSMSVVRWRRPMFAAVAPSLLKAGENELILRTVYRGGAHVLAGVQIGPMAALAPTREGLLVRNVDLPWVGMGVSSVVALLFGLLWQRRRDPFLGLFMLLALCWALRGATFVVETMPVWERDLLGATYYASTGAFSALMTITLLRLAGRSQRREEWAALGVALIGPLLSVVGGSSITGLLDQIWIPLLLLMPLAALLMVLARRLRAAEAPDAVVIAACALALCAGAHDYALQQGWITHMGGLALHWAGPVLLMALATPLVDRFVSILKEAETARGELESRVREREQLLKRNYERLRDSERIKAEGQERQRIMQDMHDGLGSQLLSSLMLVERGAATKEDVAQILRDAMDDLRLAIDALAPEDADLASALGNLRFRMEPRLKAAGMDFVWDARQLPSELDINPDAVLPILRIVQEALSNALKHSKARTVRVALAVETVAETQWLDLRITDNGVGTAEERSGGRGLLNMRNRAGRIGAQIKIETVPGSGTMVRVRYKLDPAFAGTSARASQTVLNTQAVIERARQQG